VRSAATFVAWFAFAATACWCTLGVQLALAAAPQTARPERVAAPESTYPARPLRLIVPFPPGGGADFMPHVQSGRIRALAITGAKRSTLLPEMPTLAESGVRGFEINPWFGVLGPAGLPAPILRKLHDDVVSSIRTDDTKQRLASQGAEAIGSTPEEFAAVIKQELEQWARIVKEIGLRKDE